MSGKERSKYLEAKNKAISFGWNKQSSETKQHVSELHKESWKNEERKTKNAIMLFESWYNKIEHPDFKKLFTSDKININHHISPFHAWDFIIHTLSGDILVDIDGSIHDISKTTNTVTDYNGNKFILSGYIQFKDSQRPYQTDGYDAYIVKCYDDNITNSTNVINLKTNENMVFKEFIAILQFMNMNDEEKKKLNPKNKNINYQVQRLSKNYVNGEIP